MVSIEIAHQLAHFLSEIKDDDVWLSEAHQSEVKQQLHTPAFDCQLQSHVSQNILGEHFAANQVQFISLLVIKDIANWLL